MTQKNKQVTSFAIGDRVAEIIETTSEGPQEPCYGVVSDITAKGKVMVHWDSDWRNRDNHFVDVSSLMPESEAKEEFNRLEQEFDQLADELQDKINAASQLINQAADMAKKQGYTLSEMGLNRSLYSAMDQAGWNTSSFGC